MPLTFGSLFAGIGGFDLGFERSGMTCEWQVEIDDYCNRVLAKQWPSVRRWQDVRTFPPEPSSEWRVDVICGGFPCQDISYAGRGAGLEGERSGLFFEAIRVVQQLRPRIVVLENVAALLTRGLDRVLGELGQIGFNAEWHCIPAAAVGAPHIRDRVFVVGYSNCSNSSGDDLSRQQGKARFKAGRLQATFVIASSESVGRNAGRGVEGDKKETQFRRSESAGSRSDVADTGCQLPQKRKKRSGDRRSGAIIESSGDAWKWWAAEPDVGRVAYGIPKRVDRLRGLGNAIVPQVAEWIGRRIVSHCG